MHPKNISIQDYTYELPNEKIAAFPLSERDASKILVYKDGYITEDLYKNIADHIPEKSLLVFNNTKVIQARILFQKPTGGVIEIFCLEPYEAINEYSTIMNKKEKVKWKCMIGGASKWKEGGLIKEIKKESGELKASLVEKLPDAYVVELSWQPSHLTFAEVLELTGDMPLPPYIKRKAEISDKERYQTIYAAHDGSVAAPTAGLHFTQYIFNELEKKNISKTYVALHVGAGTFKPVKAAVMEGHEMHAEWIDVSITAIQELADNIEHTIIAVGTTSLRTIESLYWMGVKTILSPSANLEDLSMGQWDVYEEPLSSSDMHAKTAFKSLINWMKKNSPERIVTTTQILISPGYQYKVAKAIITNFHQPQSTLLLLVAAAVGSEWKKIYQYALENEFRFLSYGDGSLLFLPAVK
jgi:S-adenosylmethionine:tRNA ribosyltransferase-isomerase